MSLTSQRAAAGTQMLQVEVMYYVLRCLARAGSKLAVLNNLISLLTAMCPQSWRKMRALLSDTQLCLRGFCSSSLGCVSRMHGVVIAGVLW